MLEGSILALILEEFVIAVLLLLLYLCGGSCVHLLCGGLWFVFCNFEGVMSLGVNVCNFAAVVYGVTDLPKIYNKDCIHL